MPATEAAESESTSLAGMEAPLLAEVRNGASAAQTLRDARSSFGGRLHYADPHAAKTEAPQRHSSCDLQRVIRDQSSSSDS